MQPDSIPVRTPRAPSLTCIICGVPSCRSDANTCGRQNCLRQRQRRYERQHEAKVRAAKPAEMVECLLCGGRYEFLGRHLQRHGVSVPGYQERFPGAQMLSEAMKQSRGRGGDSKTLWRDYNGKKPDRRLFEFLTGAMLGDGSLEQKWSNARYAEGGSNREYLEWKHSFLSKYFHCRFKEKLSAPHVKSGKRYLGWWVRTSAHPILTEWRAAWYKPKKIVPWDLVSRYLSPFALAVWFCDDGHSGAQTYLYPMAFTVEEVGRLRWLLELSFGLSASIRTNSRGHPLLAFPNSEAPKLRSIVAASALPGMEYKYGVRRAALS